MNTQCYSERSLMNVNRYFDLEILLVDTITLFEKKSFILILVTFDPLEPDSVICLNSDLVSGTVLCYCSSHCLSFIVTVLIY